MNCDWCHKQCSSRSCYSYYNNVRVIGLCSTCDIKIHEVFGWIIPTVILVDNYIEHFQRPIGVINYQ